MNTFLCSEEFIITELDCNLTVSIFKSNFNFSHSRYYSTPWFTSTPSTSCWSAWTTTASSPSRISWNTGRREIHSHRWGPRQLPTVRALKEEQFYSDTTHRQIKVRSELKVAQNSLLFLILAYLGTFFQYSVSHENFSGATKYLHWDLFKTPV